MNPADPNATMLGAAGQPLVLQILLVGMLMAHIAGGGVAILAGYAALALRKGQRLHRVAGRVFVGGMAAMTGFALVLALLADQTGNQIASLFAAYLVATAWLAARRRDGGVGRLEIGAAVFGVAVAVIAALRGMQALAGEGRTSEGIPAAVPIVFAVVVALAAALDLRVILAKGVAGPARIRRHVWRICTGLFIATGSFFLGQRDELPRALWGPHLWVLALAPLGFLVFWMIRTRGPRRRRVEAAAAAA